MKRQILDIRQGAKVGGCCPGHDEWPNEAYANSRSKHARARDKAKEHRYVRRQLKMSDLRDLVEEVQDV